MPETHRIGIRRLFHLGIAAAMCSLAACGETTVNTALSAASVTPVAANGLTAPVGTPLPQPVAVLVLGTDQQPLAGASVAFAVTAGGGTVSDANVTTNNDGLASTRWTMGPTAGTNTMTAVVNGITATINAVSTAGRPAAVVISAGDAQTAPAGTAVAVAPAVRVNDANGNPVAGAAVTFTVQSGGGRVTNGVRLTNAGGIATVGSWVLGNTAGPQSLTALVGDGSVTNNPITFTATAVAGAATQVAAQSQQVQSAPAGTSVTSVPSVRVADANGNPVSGVAVTFAVTSGGGQIVGGTQTTNAQGIATVGGWVLGNTAGTNQLTATATGLAPVTFVANGVAGAAVLMTIRSGNNQSVQAGRLVPIAPSVTVRDAQGNAVSGVVVTFAVASGNGSVVSGRQTTDASGIAEVGGWFLGTTSGQNTLTASAPGVAGVTFTATGTPGAPVSMAANSAVAQTGVAGTAVAARPSVVVRDLVGNPVPNISVTFVVTAGNGSVVGSPAVTNDAGVATLTSWTLGALIGPNTVVASANGLPSVTFLATGEAGAAANVVAISALTQIGVPGANVGARPAVRVTDANGNRVSGVTVVFEVTSGGGSVSGATQITDAAGEASVASWTLGSSSPNTLSATVSGNNVTGNPVVFTATTASNIVITSAASPQQTSSVIITVQLADAFNTPVQAAGVPLTIVMTSGTGAIVGTTTVSTSSTGTATFAFSVTGSPGPYTFTISGTGLASATTATITLN